jgi:hypothetical protein
MAGISGVGAGGAGGRDLAPITIGVPPRAAMGISPVIVGGDNDILTKILLAVFHWLLYQYSIVEVDATEELAIVIRAIALTPKLVLELTLTS